MWGEGQQTSRRTSRRAGWPALPLVAVLALAGAGCGAGQNAHGAATPPSAAATSTATSTATAAATSPRPGGPTTLDGATGPFRGGRLTVPGTDVSVLLPPTERAYVATDPAVGVNTRLGTDPALAPYQDVGDTAIPLMAVSPTEVVMALESPPGAGPDTSLEDQAAGTAGLLEQHEHVPAGQVSALETRSGVGEAIVLSYPKPFLAPLGGATAEIFLAFDATGQLDLFVQVTGRATPAAAAAAAEALLPGLRRTD